jgi:hypothetical protein
MEGSPAGNGDDFVGSVAEALTVSTLQMAIVAADQIAASRPCPLGDATSGPTATDRR